MEIRVLYHPSQYHDTFYNAVASQVRRIGNTFDTVALQIEPFQYLLRISCLRSNCAHFVKN